MKKRIFMVAIPVMVMLICLCCACSVKETDSTDTDSTEAKSIANTIDKLEKIKGTECLVYDTNTYVVYYQYQYLIGSQYSYGYMSPYISENGHFCKYIDGEIVEITED